MDQSNPASSQRPSSRDPPDVFCDYSLHQHPSTCLFFSQKNMSNIFQQKTSVSKIITPRRLSTRFQCPVDMCMMGSTLSLEGTRFFFSWLHLMPLKASNTKKCWELTLPKKNIQVSWFSYLSPCRELFQRTDFSQARHLDARELDHQLLQKRISENFEEKHFHTEIDHLHKFTTLRKNTTTSTTSKSWPSNILKSLFGSKRRSTCQAWHLF